MEIPFGHRAKILKKIKEFKTHRGKFSSFNNSNEKIESDIQTNFEIEKIKHDTLPCFIINYESCLRSF